MYLKMLSCVLIVTFFVLLVHNSVAITEFERSELRLILQIMAFKCKFRYPLTPNDVRGFKNMTFPDGKNAPCFTACVFKYIGLIDNQGNYTHEPIITNVRKVFHDENDVKNFDKMLTQCDKVKKIDDDKSGCQLAKRAYICLIEEAEKYGFSIDV